MNIAKTFLKLERLNYQVILNSGGENVGLRRRDFRHVVGPLSRPRRLQQLRNDGRLAPVFGPMVPYVRQDMHLYELVRQLLKLKLERNNG